MIPSQVIDRYNDMLDFIEPQQEDEPGTSLPHVKWMLSVVSTLTDVEKQMRWLGFIQGIIITNGLTTVTAERNFTRPFFSKVT